MKGMKQQAVSMFWAFPKSSSHWYRIHLQCRGCRFNPWVGRIPWRRRWQLTSVFLPEKSCGQRSLVGYRNNSATKPHQIFQNLGGKKLTRLSATKVSLVKKKRKTFRKNRGLCGILKYHTPTLPRWSNGKKWPANAGDMGSVPGLGRFHVLQGNDAHGHDY